MYVMLLLPDIQYIYATRVRLTRPEERRGNMKGKPNWFKKETKWLLFAFCDDPISFFFYFSLVILFFLLLVWGLCVHKAPKCKCYFLLKIIIMFPSAIHYTLGMSRCISS